MLLIVNFRSRRMLQGCYFNDEGHSDAPHDFPRHIPMIKNTAGIIRNYFDDHQILAYSCVSWLATSGSGSSSSSSSGSSSSSSSRDHGG